MNAAWGELAAYWTDMLADRRANPLDPSVDFVTMMSNAPLGDAPMPDIDIIDIMVTLTLGSLDTLKSQLGWQLWHLATHPDDRARIVADPALIPSAVEEFLRAYPIVVDGPQGDPRRRLPRLPDEEGRHGPADDPGRHPRSAGLPGRRRGDHRPQPRTATSRSGPASTAASARTSPGPSCSWPSRSGSA